MKKAKSWNRLLSLALCLCMVLSLVPGMPLAASAATEVSYVDCAWDGTKVVKTTKTVTEYTVVTAETTAMSDGWYVVNSDVKANGPIAISGHVHLVLVDGWGLTVPGSVTITKDNSLTVYGQSQGTGFLTASTSNGNAGIGGTMRGTFGTFTVNGGTVNATGSIVAPAIGSGEMITNVGAGTITINGGTVNATSKSNAAAIGSASNEDFKAGNTITINGGTVNATCQSNGAAIGSGNQSAMGNITINGGVVTAKNTGSRGYASAIGGAYMYANNGSITINGGVVTASTATHYGRYAAPAIGSGYGCVSTVTIAINGGTVSAMSSKDADYSIGGSETVVTVDGGNIYTNYGIGDYWNDAFKVTNSNGEVVSLQTVTLAGAAAGTPVTGAEGLGSYGFKDVQTLDNCKLHLYLPADTAAASFTADGTVYDCRSAMTYYPGHAFTEGFCITFCKNCGAIGEDSRGHSYGDDGICTDCGQDTSGLYHISTAEQLRDFAAIVNSGGRTANAILEADIDLENVEWVTICETGLYYNGYGEDLGYAGTFDGNGHIIKNITVKSSATMDASCGLFGTVSGTVKNLGVEGFTFVDGGKDIRTGAIVGQLITANGLVENCYVKNATILPGDHVTGGIAGCVYDGTIKNCYVVESSINGASNRYGYIVGDSRGDGGTSDRPGTVKNCYTDNATIRSNNVGNVTDCATKTAQQFASGEVTWLLNEKSAQAIWKQTLTEQDYPGFTGMTVYPYADTCDITAPMGYTNDVDAVVPHSYGQDDICSACGFLVPAVRNGDVYEISSVGQYLWFAGAVNSGSGNLNAKLMADIDLTNYASKYGNIIIGTSSVNYSGVFDGNGKTLTVNLDGAANMAPFGYLNGATVKSLNVAGTIKASGKFAAGITSYSYGTTTIDRCMVSVTIESSVSGDGTHGGLVGVSESGSLTVSNCAFVGTINGADTHSCGGFVGWANTATKISNSYLCGTLGTNTSSCYTFGRNPKHYTIANCYYLDIYGTANDGAVQMTAGQFASGQVAYLLGEAFGQTIGTDELPVLGGVKVYYGYVDCQTTEMSYTNDADISPDKNAHSYNTNGFCVNTLADGSSCGAYQEAALADGIYQISNAGQLYWFAALVNGGDDDAHGMLMADIDLENRIWYPIGLYNDIAEAGGKSVQLQYKGIFDGNNHTVSNFTATGTGSQGLIGYSAASAVVKNLGVINATVSGWNAGAVLAYMGTVENCYAVDCKVTANTEASSAFGVYAGAVAGTQQAAVKNCFAYNCEVKAGEEWSEQSTIAPIGGRTSTNGYYASVTAANGTFRTGSGETEVLSTQLESGEVAYLLGEAWGQTIGEDAYPTLGGAEVYYGYLSCADDAQICYTNDASASTDKPGHSWTDATCTEARTCDLCKVTEGDALGHSYADGTCGVCGEPDPDYVPTVSQPSITLKYPTLSFKDEILLNVYFEASGLEDAVEFGLITYSTQVDSWSVHNAEKRISGYRYNQSSGLYKVTTNGIPAKNMGDTIWFAVYAKLSDGTYCYSKLVDYSPAMYAYSLLGTEGPELDALLVSMLNYGAAAQTYFGHNTENLVNKDLTEEQLALAEAYRSDMMPTVATVDVTKQGSFANTGGFTDKRPSVSFKGAFMINYYCTPESTPVDGITLYYWKRADFDAADVLTAENATGTVEMTLTDTGAYKASVTGISAKNMGDGVYVAFVYTDGTTTYSSGVLPYSVGTYCNDMANAPDGFDALAQATAVYGYSAKQYFLK